MTRPTTRRRWTLRKRRIPPPRRKSPNTSNRIVEEMAESELFKVGDIVDILETDEETETAGRWIEGAIA